MGREDCQEGWHRLMAAFLHPGESLLDVGSGLGRIKERIPTATTQEVVYGLGTDIVSPVDCLPDKSSDIVTAFDVVEHVVEDGDFLQHLCRIARKMVFITTPNYNVSKAANGCHCREYTPEEFIQLIKLGCPPNTPFMLFVGNGKGDSREAIGHRDFMLHNHPHQAALIRISRS